MAVIHQRITIIQIRKPNTQNLNDELQWLGNSLGLFNLRDTNRSCFRVFLELLKASKKHDELSSDDLAEKLELSRGTVIHHINKLLEAGIVINQGKKYYLREERLQNLIEDIRKDLTRACEDMMEAAKKIDEILTM